MIKPNILANNVFYYYADLARAHRFYEKILGFEMVADYGFAKMLRIAESSYITLVDVESGMHSLDDPQTTTIAMVTDQVAEWYSYLQEKDVVIERPFTVKEGSGHDGFVALDPEGYFLEFEVFNPHPENEHLLPVVNKMPETFDPNHNRPDHLGVRATVQWMYYTNLPAIQTFYEALLRQEMICDQGWAKLYQTSETALIGLVDGAKGLHGVSDTQRVNVSFMTDAIEKWYKRAKKTGKFERLSQEIDLENDVVRTFVGYDLGGYTLEWDEFCEHPVNEKLLDYLS